MRCYWWEGKNTGKYKGEREREGRCPYRDDKKI
jgi:hypothetical protein